MEIAVAVRAVLSGEEPVRVVRGGERQAASGDREPRGVDDGACV